MSVVVTMRCDLCGKDGTVAILQAGIGLDAKAPDGWVNVGDHIRKVHVCDECVKRPISDLVKIAPYRPLLEASQPESSY